MTRIRTLAVLIGAAIMILALPAAASAKKAPKSFFGVISQAELTGADYDNMRRGKIGNLRTSFNWASVQSSPGRCQSSPAVAHCSWTNLDAQVANAARAGVEILPILSGTPGFVSSKKPNKPPLKKRDFKMWKAFVKAAADRYGRRGDFWRNVYSGKPKPIKDWQVWNEPNSRQFWSGKPNGRKYAKLVKGTSKALRKGDRKADVVLGGLFHNALVPLPKFLKQFYKKKRIKRFFDEIALHPYAEKPKELRKAIKEARRSARKGGDRKVGIRITEIGWSSKKGKHDLMVGKKGQAKMLKKAFRLLTKKRKRWNIEGLNWFAWQDTRNPDTCRFCRDSGLFKVNGKPKPSWRQYRKFSR